MLNLRNRYIYISLVTLVFLFSTAFYLRTSPFATTIREKITSPSEPASPEPYPRYKPEPKFTIPPVVDNFPIAAAAHSAADLPPVAAWVRPPTKHVEEATPLLIGFTRNWRLLQQVVVSYINAGWPPSDIYVVENTGVMDSNAKGRLSLQNPFFVNHTRLNMFGVNILRTPTLLSFAQLQNFYLHTSLENEWPIYFWSHMDVIALSMEDKYAEHHPDSLAHDADHTGFETVYTNCVKALRDTYTLSPPDDHWAMRFFNYDRLALVNVAAFVDVGGWDTMIPYYMTDCDMHARIQMAKWDIKDVPAGILSDVASSLDDLIVLYRKSNTGVHPSFTDPNKLEAELEEAAKKTEEEGKGKSRIRRAEEASKEKIATKETEESGKGKPSTKDTPTDGTAKDKSKEEWGKSALGKSTESTTESKSKWQDDDIRSANYDQLVGTMNAMEVSKGQSSHGRNTWQTRQKGGEGEPFFRDAKGFDDALQMTIEHGRFIFGEKWGHRGCDIREKGLVASDAWRVEHDF